MTISAAIIGSGRMGRFHAERLAAIDDVRIVGAADVRREAADELVASYGGTAYDDYRELIERTRPDVAYLCTPADEHLEQLTFVAERGVNAFVEKPLAPSVVAAKAAADVVERHGILCTVGYQWRYNPTTDIALRVLGDLPVTMLSGWWYWTIPPIPWIADKRTGGGQVFEQATHLIDLMRYLGGEISTVYAAYADNAIPYDELPNWNANAVTFGFDGGAVGSLHTTYALFPGIPDNNGVDVVARDVLVRIGSGRATVFRPKAEPVATCAPDGWNIDQSYVSILRRDAPDEIRATARESARSIAVSLAANYSAVTGKVVDLDAFLADPPTDVELAPDQST